MINTKIKATNLKLTRAVRRNIWAHSEGMKKYIRTSDENVVCEYEIERIKGRGKKGVVFRAEMNIELSGLFLRAEARSSDVQTAMDKVKEEMSRKLSERAAKHDQKKKKGGRKLKSMLKAVQ